MEEGEEGEEEGRREGGRREEVEKEKERRRTGDPGAGQPDMGFEPTWSSSHMTLPSVPDWEMHGHMCTCQIVEVAKTKPDPQKQNPNPVESVVMIDP